VETRRADVLATTYSPSTQEAKASNSKFQASLHLKMRLQVKDREGRWKRGKEKS